ncbi:MAG TPA: aldehyde dehydrogenase family protein [Campylobacterales bacterium]|nr:aldehyde dehydrogenase family protein [Campylobacterales bacterium]
MEAKIFFGDIEITKTKVDEIKNPYSGKVVATFPVCDASDATEALKIAEDSFKKNRQIALSQRISWLEDVIDKLRENREDIARTITDEVGKPIKFARIEVDRCVETLRLSISAAIEQNGETFNSDAMPSGRKTISYTMRVPIGVASLITPFNFPLNLIAHKLGPALIAGNSVVLKPTPEAPLTAYKFAKLFIESEHRSPNALSLVYGDAEVGSTMVKSPIPRAVSFTGSVPVGKIIMGQAGIKKVSLELGGNAATFIDKTAALESAANKCVLGAFVNSGQVCISLQRIYVHEDVADEFAEMLAYKAKELIVGDPYNDDTFMGPLISEESAQRAENWVQSAINEGAVALSGGKREGRMFPPTVMNEVIDDMNIVCEEVFAPIVSIIKVKDFDEAIGKINNSPYGLQYSIFTNDLSLTKRAIEEFDCGGVVVNDIPTIRFDIQPYGGSKLSGIGKEGPKYALEEFTEIKSVVIC